MSSFSDFPMPDGSPFPTGAEMQRYYNAYCVRFDLHPYIRFNSRVEEVAQRSDGRWVVAVAGVGQTIFDRVVCASGTFGAPNMAIDWLSDFSGYTLHSALYRSPNAFDSGAQIVVLGIGNSALDIALDLAVSGRFVTSKCVVFCVDSS